MTTGTRTSDLRTLVSTSCGDTRAGSYYTKTWNGTDSPSTRKSYSYVPKYRLTRHTLNGYPVYKVVLKLARDKPPRRSKDVDHPYTCTWVSSFDPLFLWNFTGSPPSLTGTISSCFGGVSVPDQTWGSLDDLALLGKLREAVAGSDFNAGVFLGEGRQSLAMIANAAVRIGGAFAAAKRGKLQRAANILTGKDVQGQYKKTSASNWLELQYGWLPLLSDVHGGAKFLAQQFAVPLQYTVRVTRRRTLTPKIGTLSVTSSKGIIKGQLIARLKEIDSVGLSGLKDPLSIAWELLPYSFVFDWFIPVGNYLSARGLSQSLTGTFVKTITLKYHISGVRALPSGFVGSSPSYRYDSGSCTRTVSTTLQVPLPSQKGFEKTASWAHAANAVALLVQKL